MTVRIAVFLAAALFLAGCSDQDWNRALTFSGLGGGHESQPQPAQAAQSAPNTPAPMTARAEPAPIPEGAQPPPNQFCEAVASQDAGGNDFDAATRQRVFVQSYRQCVAIFGDATK